MIAGPPAQPFEPSLVAVPGPPMVVAPQSSASNHPAAKKRVKPCFEWTDGKCTRGDRCMYSHDPKVSLPERLYPEAQKLTEMSQIRDDEINRRRLIVEREAERRAALQRLQEERHRVEREKGEAERRDREERDNLERIQRLERQRQENEHEKAAREREEKIPPMVVTPQASTSNHPSASKRMKPCFDWRKGKCTRGDRCMYSHDLKVSLLESSFLSRGANGNAIGPPS